MQIKQLLNEEDGYTPLYRGISANGGLEVGDFITRRIRTDRQPLDSPGLGAALFDYGIEQSLGVPRLRQQALFASTSPCTASGYGSAVLKLELLPSTPIIYNPRIRDSGDVTSLTNYDSALVDALWDIVNLRADTLDTDVGYERMKVFGGFDKKWYMNQENTITKFEQCLRALLDEVVTTNEQLETTVETTKQAFITTSADVSEGYVKIAYRDLQATGDIEVMIYGISEYDATVINPRDM